MECVIWGRGVVADACESCVCPGHVCGCRGVSEGAIKAMIALIGY